MRRYIPRAILVLAPIAFLCLDILLYPVIFEGFGGKRDVGVVPLLSRGEFRLGTFRAHAIRVSMDDIRDPNFLGNINSDRSALVISVYVDRDGEVIRGALTEALLEVLQKSSPQDARRVIDLLSQQNAINPGHIVSFDLHVPIAGSSQPRLKYLLIAPLRYGEPDQTKTELLSALPEVFSFVTDRNVSSLIVPCLGTNWRNKNSITFDEFFSSFFDTLRSGTLPRDIYFSFYREWPSFYLEAAVSSLNSNWHRSFDKAYSNFPSLYRRQFRFVILFWFLCVLIVSASVRLTLRKFLIVSVTFVLLALGAGHLVSFLTEGRGPLTALTLETVVLATLAVGFRRIVTWSAKSVFE
jgi:hypothetical protein